MKITVRDFDLEATLESGQVFGFSKVEGRSAHAYEGMIRGRLFRLRQSGDTLHASALEGPAGAAAPLRDYFDLDRDLTPVYGLLRREKTLAAALVRLKGLRLIRQDGWEALACFILSANNNLKRIQKIWGNLSRRLGRPLGRGSFSFPVPSAVAGCHEGLLRELGLGYRAPFLRRSAQFVAANPESLRVIREAPYAEARERLLAFPGVGEKVADCILLYGFQKYEAFPVDVWILRVMRKHFFQGRKVAESRVHRYGQKRWGNLAGYVQQYLFHGARTDLL